MSKLSEGRGNIVTGLEKLKELGAKAAKKIDSKYFEEDEKPAALESAMAQSNRKWNYKFLMRGLRAILTAQ